MVERKLHPRHFLTEVEKNQVAEAIREAETKTSGEIRVALEAHVKGDVFLQAQKAFGKMKMSKTRLRNGVLIFLALRQRSFAIIGDEGINRKVPAAFWQLIAEQIHRSFSAGEFGPGLVWAIAEVGTQLAFYFPRQSADVDELPNKIAEF